MRLWSKSRARRLLINTNRKPFFDKLQREVERERVMNVNWFVSKKRKIGWKCERGLRGGV